MSNDDQTGFERFDHALSDAKGVGACQRRHRSTRPHEHGGEFSAMFGDSRPEVVQVRVQRSPFPCGRPWGFPTLRLDVALRPARGERVVVCTRAPNVLALINCRRARWQHAWT